MARSVWFDSVRFGLPGLAWAGLAWLGSAWPGLAWPWLAWPGLALPGLALALPGPGPAWPQPGLAWAGLARAWSGSGVVLVPGSLFGSDISRSMIFVYIFAGKLLNELVREYGIPAPVPVS